MADCINKLWTADRVYRRTGSARLLRRAIRAARETGMTFEQIAGELMRTANEVERLAA